ncbi:MAG: hypothetical protein JWL86_4039 [Rhizobium sp.]|nr:hypothetical protein [Rhizobium sp.]
MCAWHKNSRDVGDDAEGADSPAPGKTRDELEFWINAVGSPLLVVEKHSLTIRTGNRGAGVFFGMQPEEFSGAPMSDIVGNEANQMLGQIWSNAPVGVTGEPFLIRAIVQGHERLLMVQVSKLVVEGEEVRLFSMVDAPPEGSVALAGWQENIIDMLNWLPFGFEIATSRDEQIQFANSQFSALFGYSQHEIESIEDWWQLAYPDPEYRAFARSTWEGEVARARAEDREMAPFDLEVRTASGEDRTIQFRQRSIGSFSVNLYLDVTSERRAARELKRLSEIDPLTGAMNRRCFFEEAQRQYDRDADRAVAVLVLDIDNFKSINDTHGHGAGDLVLKEFTTRCLTTVGSNGIFARFGGEEFVVLLHGDSAVPAHDMAERLRAAIDCRTFHLPQAALPVTVSIGGALRHPSEALDQTLSRADEAVYRAKFAGRNRVFIAD